MFRDELMQDIKGLSGVPIFVVLIISFLIIGNRVLGVQLLVGLVLAYVVTSIIRLIYFRRRPDNEQYHNVIGKIDASSFPSLHAMRAGVLAAILSFWFSQLAIIFVLCAIAVAASRVATRRHYVSDVVVGLILGAVIGFGVRLISF